MDKKQLINVYAAQKLMGCTLQNIWQLIRWQSLKAVKVNGKLHTCVEWIEEYQATKDNRQLHSTYNGRKVYDEEKGLFSLKTVCEQTGLSRPTLDFHMSTGRLKTRRKGMYYVVTKESLDNFKAYLAEKEKNIDTQRKFGV